MNVVCMIAFAAILSVSAYSCASADNVLSRDIMIAEEDDANSIYLVSEVDVQPQFPEGGAAMYHWLCSNMELPSPADDEKITFRATVQFIIDLDGSIKDIELKRGKDTALGKEFARVVSLMPKWTPARKNGNPVRVKYFLPVNIPPAE